MAESHRFQSQELADFEKHGYVLRRSVFAAGELREIRDACETLIETLLTAKRRTKLTVGSYVFELQRELGTVVKWEADSPDLVQGVELFAHLSGDLKRWALDSRLVDPARDVTGADDIVMFTEKLNMKRARKGGPIVLHQDFPYWSDISPVAAQIATAMVFLDDSTIENGCLEVVPGSHREGEQRRRSVEGFGKMEMDPSHYDLSRLVRLEVEAGSVAFFGPFLVHRSLPNRSGEDRRALLYSYQPAGYPHLRELIELGGGTVDS